MKLSIEEEPSKSKNFKLDSPMMQKGISSTFVIGSV